MISHGTAILGRKLGFARACIGVLVTTVLILTYLFAQQDGASSLLQDLASEADWRPLWSAQNLSSHRPSSAATLEYPSDIEAFDKTLPVPPHPIMILQHHCQCYDEHITELARHSVEQHARYAAAHGYAHRVSLAQYIPREGWSGTQYMNKAYLALQVVLEELEKGDDGVQWVM